jgi:hypothetical protein
MVKLKFKRRPVRQNIFNLNRGKPLRFVSSGHTAPTFGSFLQIPKPNFNRSLLKQPALSFYGDSDKDGVMNGFDCAPFNKKKQGPEHKKKTYLTDGYNLPTKSSFKNKEEERRAANKLILKNQEKGFNEMVKNKLSAKDEYKFRQGALVMKPNRKQPSWSDFEKAGIQVNEGPTWDERKRQEESRLHLEAESRADAMGDKFTFNPTLTDNENDRIADLVTRRNEMAKNKFSPSKAEREYIQEGQEAGERNFRQRKGESSLDAYRRQKDKEPTFEDSKELTSIPNPEGYDYDDNSDED